MGVVTKGTAGLGLGNIGPLAATPVMEGKGCLFKKFAGIDEFDIGLWRPIQTSSSKPTPCSSRPSAASPRRH
ncbi:malic enzyme [Paraburkholderia sp. JPY419]